MLATTHRTIPYTNTGRTVQEMERLIKSPRGELSLELRQTVEEIVRHVRERDKRSQLAAIYHWFRPRYSFFEDPRQVEQVSDPMRVIEEIRRTGRFIGDCDDASTFLAAAPRTIGIKTYLVRVGFRPPRGDGLSGPYTHVLAVGVDQHKTSIVLDPVADRRTGRMVQAAKQVVRGY
jgi:transglutaminase-like putative cysteine protease